MNQRDQRVAATPKPEPLSIPLSCGTCLRNLALSYVPGPQPIAATYFCPYCHKVNRLELLGQIRGVAKAHKETF